MTAEWFSGEAGGPRERAVLTSLRRLVSERGLHDARPEDTRASAVHDCPLMLTVLVPDLLAARGAPELHVGVFLEEDQVQLVGGWETFGFALDSEVEQLDLARSAEPSAISASLQQWMVEQLSRPVLQDEWTTWSGRVRRSWRFGDDGYRIEGDPGTRRLARRRAPDRVVPLR